MWFLATKVIVNNDTNQGFAKFCQNSAKKIIKNIAFQVHKLATTLPTKKGPQYFKYKIQMMQSPQKYFYDIICNPDISYQMIFHRYCITIV